MAPILIKAPVARIVAGDGNCLYASILDQFDQRKATRVWLYTISQRHNEKRRKRYRLSVRLLRILTVTWLRRNRDTPLPMIDNLTIGELYESGRRDDLAWEEYLRSQRIYKPTPLPMTSWGDEHCIIAIANKLRVTIVVYQQIPTGKVLSHVYTPLCSSRTTVHLIYSHENHHYSSVELH